MQVSVETTSQIERRITIQVPAGEIDEAVNTRLKETAKNVRLNGFRQGRVPMAVVRQRYGQSVRNEVVGEVMRERYVRAITDEGFNPAGYPQIEPVVNEAGKDFEFVATMEVYPDVELASIEGTEVERPVVEVTDADVDEMIDTLRKQNATYEEVDSAAQDGDQVTIDFQGYLGDEPFEGGSAEGHELVIGSNSFIPGFEEQLIGAKVGDDKTITVTFPEDYQAEHLAGKEATFKVKVHKVSRQALPEVDAEFIERFGVEGGDEAKFRTEIKKNMTREAEQAVDNRVKQQVLDALKKANDIPVPSALVQQETDGMKRQAAQQFGLGEDFDVSQLPNELFEEQAKGRVQVGLLLAEVIKANELDASDDEIKAKVEELAEQYQDPSEVVDYYMGNEQMKTQVKSAILEEKAVDKLLEQATVADVDMSYQQVLAAAQQQAEAGEGAEEDETTNA
ncbi:MULTISPECIES: trigger factor [Halomonadaceae]|jgi:trigger factor|uniref:Trigger factor n=1 Tax=Vreelandella janggokensis TaxID=370767 RepID=A0ABT4IRK6_9GAMM|nr:MULTISPECIES: trigger factor [Halomonas]MCW4153442.1 trigger factor [Halomonas sp. 18H]MCZ0926297.1 trigger factor [Halomonas janggokensis]MCZ0928835.1 trigger factor [Halomonas janggokensis]MDR5885632.1 trigger factor [Halomonas janggokensis]QPL47810.1 trigger factor [Halomonas sp. A40-4]